MKNLLFFLLLMAGNLPAQDYKIYVSDAGNFNVPPWQILKYDSDGSNPEVFIADHLNWPQDILFRENENIVLISNFGTNRISKFEADSGRFLSEFAYGILGPTRMKIGPDSLLYVLQWGGNGKVKRFQLDGTFVDDFTSRGVDQSIGMDWDVDGNLYVSSYNLDHVRKFDPTGQDMGLFIQSNLAGPTNIWFDDGGDLLVLDYDATSVKRFGPDGTYLGAFLTGLSKSEGVALLPDGNILIGNGASNSVKQFNQNGQYIDDLIPSGSGGLMTPNAVVIRLDKVTKVSNIETNDFIFFQNEDGEIVVEEKDMDVLILLNPFGQIILSSNDNTLKTNGLPGGVYYIFAKKGGQTFSAPIMVK
ncbi:MAG: hypothetical protein KDC24_10205 [Saprospiraceae bacterium]|nr:hypothetical protein [Saprospiraceae bacterium]